MEKKFYQSPNFWLAVVLLIGGFFIGFPADAAEGTVSAVFALIGGAGILYKYFKTSPGTAAKPWLQDANFWNYFSAIFLAIAPEIGAVISPALQEVVTQLLRGNWGGAIMGFVSLATIIIKIIQSRPAQPAQLAK